MSDVEYILYFSGFKTAENHVLCVTLVCFRNLIAFISVQIVNPYSETIELWKYISKSFMQVITNSYFQYLANLNEGSFG